ncbi:MAG TPA: hypothetical protein IGS52_07320 [Oscillatoriaceae cyanobacterium M33_DOE_052]|nr:hypothetical protein [Oscillatoriaceae cyanobacterium M33_DOE_052]
MVPRPAAPPAHPLPVLPPGGAIGEWEITLGAATIWCHLLPPKGSIIT